MMAGGRRLSPDTIVESGWGSGGEKTPFSIKTLKSNRRQKHICLSNGRGSLHLGVDPDMREGLEEGQETSLTLPP